MARVTDKSRAASYAPGRTPTPAEPAAPATGAVTKPATVSARDTHVDAPKPVSGRPVTNPAPAHVVVPPAGNVIGSQLPANLTALDGQRGFVRVEQPTRAQLTGAVAMSFEEGKGQPNVELKAGGKFLLTYDPKRSQYTGYANGIPSYGVTAYVQLQPSGKIIEKPAVAFEQTSSRVQGQPYPAPVLVDLPAGTTGVAVWFKQFSYGDRPAAEGWDSNYGQNYNFQVR